MKKALVLVCAVVLACFAGGVEYQSYIVDADGNSKLSWDSGESEICVEDAICSHTNLISHGGLLVDGGASITGPVTATSYEGDGSALTGVVAEPDLTAVAEAVETIVATAVPTPVPTSTPLAPWVEAYHATFAPTPQPTYAYVAPTPQPTYAYVAPTPEATAVVEYVQTYHETLAPTPQPTYAYTPPTPVPTFSMPTTITADKGEFSGGVTAATFTGGSFAGTTGNFSGAVTAASFTGAGTATKEVFVPVAVRYTGSFSAGYNANVGEYPVATVSDTQEAYFTFYIPSDFVSLTSAVIVCIPDATETIQWDIAVAVAAVGEDYDNDVTTAVNQTQAVTINDVTELSVATQMANAAANDYIGIHFESDTSSLRIIGLRIKYQ